MKTILFKPNDIVKAKTENARRDLSAAFHQKLTKKSLFRVLVVVNDGLDYHYQLRKTQASGIIISLLDEWGMSNAEINYPYVWDVKRFKLINRPALRPVNRF